MGIHDNQVLHENKRLFNFNMQRGRKKYVKVI